MVTRQDPEALQKFEEGLRPGHLHYHARVAAACGNAGGNGQRQPGRAHPAYRYADLEGIIGALNEARVYRFIPKPWNDYELRFAVRQALSIRAMQLEKPAPRRPGAAAARPAQPAGGGVAPAGKKRASGITRIQRDESGAIFIDEDDL